MANESYAGVDGEAREISYVKVGASGVRHVIAAYAGVDGEVRLIPGLCKIDHIEVRLVAVECYDSSGTQISVTLTYTSSTGLEYIVAYDSDGNKVAEIDFNDYTSTSPYYGKCATAFLGTNSNAATQVIMRFHIYAIFPDGCEVRLDTLCSAGGRTVNLSGQWHHNPVYGALTNDYGFYYYTDIAVADLDENVIVDAVQSTTSYSSFSTSLSTGGIVFSAELVNSSGGTGNGTITFCSFSVDSIDSPSFELINSAT